MKLKQETKNAIWSMVRLCITAMLGVVISHVSNGHDIFSINWKEIVGAGVVAGVMFLRNWFSPTNLNYGPQPKTEL